MQGHQNEYCTLHFCSGRSTKKKPAKLVARNNLKDLGVRVLLGNNSSHLAKEWLNVVYLSTDWAALAKRTNLEGINKVRHLPRRLPWSTMTACPALSFASMLS